MEFAGIPPAVAEVLSPVQGLTVPDNHLLVHTIRHEDPLLLRILGRMQCPTPSRRLGGRLVIASFTKLAFGVKTCSRSLTRSQTLDTAGSTRHVGAVHGIADLLRIAVLRIVQDPAACRPACCHRRPPGASSCLYRHRSPRRDGSMYPSAMYARYSPWHSTNTLSDAAAEFVGIQLESPATNSFFRGFHVLTATARPFRPAPDLPISASEFARSWVNFQDLW